MDGWYLKKVPAPTGLYIPSARKTIGMAKEQTLSDTPVTGRIVWVPLDKSRERDVRGCRYIIETETDDDILRFERCPVGYYISDQIYMCWCKFCNRIVYMNFRSWWYRYLVVVVSYNFFSFESENKDLLRLDILDRCILSKYAMQTVAKPNTRLSLPFGGETSNLSTFPQRHLIVSPPLIPIVCFKIMHRITFASD